MSRYTPLIVAVFCVLTLGGSRLAFGPMVRIVHNATDSVPLGFYSLSSRPPQLGDLVVLETPVGVRQLVQERNYLPKGDRLLKQIVGAPNSRWCVDDDRQFTVSGEIFGEAFLTDSQGASLPKIRGCFFVPPGHVLVATHHPRSFDSRYFGAVPTDSIVGVAEALWTYSL